MYFLDGSNPVQGTEILHSRISFEIFNSCDFLWEAVEKYAENVIDAVFLGGHVLYERHLTPGRYPVQNICQQKKTFVKFLFKFWEDLL